MHIRYYEYYRIVKHDLSGYSRTRVLKALRSCSIALWAIATVISKKLLTSVPPITLLVVQLAPSVLLLWSLTILKGGPRPRRRSLVPLAFIGLLNPGLAYTLSMLGLTRTTASVATLLWAAEPILIVTLAWLLLHEPVTRRLIMLTVSAACGVL